jgi:anaerobic magnesium-protoporphyrin IX monomethyl ester cyclase
MHVTLINPPWFFQRDLEFLSQNLGIAYLAGALEQRGHRVSVIDSVAEAPGKFVEVEAKYERVRRYGLSYGEICARIPPETGLVGISVPFSHSRRIYEELSTEIKRRFPSVPLVGGGVYPSTQPEEALKAAVDCVVIGEGEGPITDLADGKPVGSIPGLAYRSGRRDSGSPPPLPSSSEGGGGNGYGIVRNPRREPVRDLDSLPFPARHLLPVEKYMSLSARGLEDFRTAAMITSRGCPFDCAFCSVHPVYGRTYRKASAERVLKEIVHLIETYDIDHIEFEDDNLTLDAGRAEEIFRGLIEIRNRLKPITWEDPNGIRIDTLTPSLIRLARESGCRCLFLALEHGDEEMRQMMNKRLENDAVEQAVAAAAAAGMPVLLFFIVGYPGETRERFENGVRFCRHLRRLGAGRFEVFIAKPYPGSRLLEICREKVFLRYPDIENLVFNMDTVAIETADFDAAEVLRRREYALEVLNPYLYRFKGPLLRVFPRRWLRRAKRFVGIQ